MVDYQDLDPSLGPEELDQIPIPDLLLHGHCQDHLGDHQSVHPIDLHPASVPSLQDEDHSHLALIEGLHLGPGQEHLLRERFPGQRQDLLPSDAHSHLSYHPTAPRVPTGSHYLLHRLNDIPLPLSGDEEVTGVEAGEVMDTGTTETSTVAILAHLEVLPLQDQTFPFLQEIYLQYLTFHRWAYHLLKNISNITPMVIKNL